MAIVINPNTKRTFFTATGVASTPLQPNAIRRAMWIQIFGPPDVTGGITVWADWCGNAAVPFQCWQLISGAIWAFGVPDPKEFARESFLPNCPIGALSVITASGTAQGLIIEMF